MDKEIGKALRQVRLERGLTQQQFADMLGLHRPAYTLVESGRQKLTVAQLLVISVRLGIPLSEMEARLKCLTTR